MRITVCKLTVEISVHFSFAKVSQLLKFSSRKIVFESVKDLAEFTFLLSSCESNLNFIFAFGNFLILGLNDHGKLLLQATFHAIVHICIHQLFFVRTQIIHFWGT